MIKNRGNNSAMSSLRGEFADGRSATSPDNGTTRADKSERTKSPRLCSVEKIQDRALATRQS